MQTALSRFAAAMDSEKQRSPFNNGEARPGCRAYKAGLDAAGRPKASIRIFLLTTILNPPPSRLTLVTVPQMPNDELEFVYRSA
jgi:hypothetical protein